MVHRPPRLGMLGLLLALAALPSLGCTTTTPAKSPDKEATAPRPPKPVSDGDFALAMLQVLRGGQNAPERSSLLAGVTQRQLAHAAEHFERGDRIRGTEAVLGALYLLRPNEARADMFGPAGDRALAGAIERLSGRGDEGRVLALLAMRRSLQPKGSPVLAEIDGRLATLHTWIRETRTGSDMERLSSTMRIATDRALVAPTDATLAEAAAATSAWVDRAVRYHIDYRRTGEPPPPEELREVLRALQTGPTTMAALYLRAGRAEQALTQISKSPLSELASPALRQLLAATAGESAADAWQTLAETLAQEEAIGDAAMQLEPALHDTALFGVALEAYRGGPPSLGVAHVLATLLGRFGMPEAGPLLLAEALGQDPSPPAVGGALSVVAESLAAELDTGVTPTAQRIFAASAPLLQLADRPALRDRVKPSAAQLRHLMAGIEIRSGQLAAARPLLTTALEAEPTVWGYTMLAMLERQVGDLKTALRYAQRALDLPAAQARLPGSGHQLDAVEAHLLVEEIRRAEPDPAGAATALAEASRILTDVLATKLAPANRLRGERLRGRLLDVQGDHAGASQALTRAVDMAATLGEQLGPTMLAAVARALVWDDLPAARQALQRGIEGDVDQEDLVYAALWVMFLEQRLREPPDGKVERVLGRAALGDGWTATLARWARGRFDDEALRRSGKSYAQQVEAQFYLSMKSSLGGASAAAAELRRIGSNPLIDLVEVQIARELGARSEPFVAKPGPSTAPPKR